MIMYCARQQKIKIVRQKYSYFLDSRGFFFPVVSKSSRIARPVSIAVRLAMAFNPKFSTFHAVAPTLYALRTALSVNVCSNECSHRPLFALSNSCLDNHQNPVFTNNHVLQIQLYGSHHRYLRV